MTNKEQDETVESDAELRSRLSTIFDCELDHRLDAAMTLIEAHYKAKYEVKEPSYDGRSRPLIVMRNYFTRYNPNHKRRFTQMTSNVDMTQDDELNEAACSNCCGAGDIYDGNLDNNEGICADCGEHCEMEEVSK